MLIDADLRGKIWADKTFIQSVLRMNEKPSSNGDQGAVSDPSDVFIQRISKAPQLKSISVQTIPSSFSIRESDTWGLLREYSLLNELKSNYALFMKYIPDLVDKHELLYESFLRLFNAEYAYFEFHLNQGRTKILLDYIKDVESFLENGLPIEVSWLRGTNPHHAFQSELASMIPLSDCFSKSALWGNGTDPLVSKWWEEYWWAERIRSRNMLKATVEIKFMTHKGRKALSKEVEDYLHTIFTGGGIQFYNDYKSPNSFKTTYSSLHIYFRSSIHSRLSSNIRMAYKECDRVCKMFVSDLTTLAQDWKRAQDQALAAKEEERRRLRSEKAKLEAKKKAEEKARKQQIADEKEQKRLKEIQQQQRDLVSRCKKAGMAPGFCKTLASHLKGSEFLCSWEAFLHQVWIPLGKPKDDAQWTIGHQWVLSSFSWDGSVDEFQEHIAACMSKVVDPLMNNHATLMELLQPDLKTYKRVVGMMKEKDFFDVKPDHLVGVLTASESRFKTLRNLTLQFIDQNIGISTIDRILGRLLAGEDEAFVLADEGVAFQT